MWRKHREQTALVMEGMTSPPPPTAVGPSVHGSSNNGPPNQQFLDKHSAVARRSAGT